MISLFNFGYLCFSGALHVTVLGDPNQAVHGLQGVFSLRKPAMSCHIHRIRIQTVGSGSGVEGAHNAA